MSTNIKFDIQGIYNKLNSRTEYAKSQLLKQILADSNELVPFRTGKLRRSGVVVPDGVEWTVDYAQEVYRSTSPHKVGTREWFEYAKQANLKKWIKQFENDLKNGG